MSSFDPLDIRGQERAKEDAQKRDRLAQVNEAEDFKWLMSSKRGRRTMWRLLDQAGVFRLSFNTNALTMAFSEGNRNYGLRLLALIHTLCPELYPTMQKEQKNDRDADDDRRNEQ
jgi:hypothetical protein